MRAPVILAYFGAEGRPVRGAVAAALGPNPQPVALPVGQNTPWEGQRHQVKIILFIRISDYRIESHPNPAEGRIAIVTNAGWDVVDAGGVGANGFAGAGDREQDHAHTTGAIGVRQNRVVLTPGVCASSVAVMWVPNRAYASAIRNATGAIVHRSPGRARHNP